MEGWKGVKGKKREGGGGVVVECFHTQETSSGDQPTDVCDQAPPNHNQLFNPPCMLLLFPVISANPARSPLRRGSMQARLA